MNQSRRIIVSGFLALAAAPAVIFPRPAAAGERRLFIRSAVENPDGTATLPLYRGLAPGGGEVFYIITDASDFEVARQMGINYAPKMAKAAGTPGAQAVTLANGVMQFRGNVDFAPVYQVTPGDPPTSFPPKSF